MPLGKGEALSNYTDYLRKSHPSDGKITLEHFHRWTQIHRIKNQIDDKPVLFFRCRGKNCKDIRMVTIEIAHQIDGSLKAKKTEKILTDEFL